MVAITAKGNEVNPSVVCNFGIAVVGSLLVLRCLLKQLVVMEISYFYGFA